MKHSDYLRLSYSKNQKPAIRKVVTRIILVLILISCLCFSPYIMKYLFFDNNFLSLIKNNSTELNIILTSILIIITAIYVLFTGYYVKITNRILKEAILNRTTQYRPDFFINFFNTIVEEKEMYGNSDKIKVTDVTFEILLENYSKSYAYNPKIHLTYVYKKNDPLDWAVASTEVSLGQTVKIAPDYSTKIPAKLLLHLTEVNNLPRPAIHLEFIYEDIERNLFSHSLFMILREEVNSSPKKYFVKSIREEIYVISRDSRTNIFDRSMPFIYQYNIATKIFSRYSPFE